MRYGTGVCGPVVFNIIGQPGFCKQALDETGYLIPHTITFRPPSLAAHTQIIKSSMWRTFAAPGSILKKMPRRQKGSARSQIIDWLKSDPEIHLRTDLGKSAGAYKFSALFQDGEKMPKRSTNI
jgi:hypothetical protein